MQSSPSGGDPVEQVTVSLAGLEITVSVHRTTSASSFSLVSSVAPSVTGPDHRQEDPEWGPFDQPVVGYPASIELEEQAISAVSAEQFVLCPCRFWLRQDPNYVLGILLGLLQLVWDVLFERECSRHAGWKVHTCTTLAHLSLSKTPTTSPFEVLEVVEVFGLPPTWSF